MKHDRVGIPMERVGLDLLGPFTESRNKNKYVLSIVINSPGGWSYFLLGT